MGKSGRDQKMKQNSRKNTRNNKRAFIDARPEKKAYDQNRNDRHDDREDYTY